jgi:TPR repeat protein
MKKIILIVGLFLAQFSFAGDLYKAAVCFEKGDYNCSFREFKSLAEQGNADAQFALGRMYDTGKGVKQDYFKAFEWYSKAVEQGDADAQYNLALMYDAGYGVKQDKQKAKKLFGQACDSKLELGCLYYKKLNEEGY